MLSGLVKEEVHMTKVSTIFQRIKANGSKLILSEIHKLFKLYYTTPVTTETVERTFSDPVE